MIHDSRLTIVLVLLTVLVGSVWFFSSEVRALGISPPWVKNHNLLRGSHFEKVVYINQGAPKEPLLATVTLNVSEEFRDWIIVKPGMEFTIPLVQLFPVTVVIDVPPDAKFGSYGGEIKITTLPEKQEEGKVTIGIGIAIALDLAVVEEEIIDYTISFWGVKPLEEGWPVKIFFTIDNKGNTSVNPQKVFLEVFDRRSSQLVKSGEASKFNSVKPFERSDILAEFPFNLSVGLYVAKVQFYKNENEVLKMELPFDVLEKGTLPKEGKTWVFWLLLGIGGFALLGLIIRFDKKTLTGFKAISQRFKKIKKIKKIKKKFKKIMQVLREKQ